MLDDLMFKNTIITTPSPEMKDVAKQMTDAASSMQESLLHLEMNMRRIVREELEAYEERRKDEMLRQLNQQFEERQGGTHANRTN